MTAPPMFTMGLKADQYAHWRAYMGMPQEQTVPVPQSLREFGRQPADEAWVFRCMSIRADAAAGIPLRVHVKDGSSWTDVEEKPDGAGDDLQYLLDQVNEAWDGAQLQAYTEAGAAIHGGSYWLKVKGRMGGPPQELHWLSGADVQPIMGPTFPVEYEYRPEATNNPIPTGKRYPAKMVIPMRDVMSLPDPYK